MSWAVIQYAIIELSGAGGDTELVPAVAGKSIHVLNYVVVSEGNVRIRFKSGAAGNLTGPMLCTQYSGISSPEGSPTEGDLFATAPGQALVVNRDAAIAAGGHLAYYLK
jgi:hypothetical protein